MSRRPRWGDRVTVRWPGGSYDFVIEYDHEEPSQPGGWVVVHGLVVEPVGPEHRRHRGFYAHQVGAGIYEMLPKNRPTLR